MWARTVRIIRNTVCAEDGDNAREKKKVHHMLDNLL